MPDFAPLIIFSNPSGTTQLRLDKEHRAVDKAAQSVAPESVIRLHAATLEDVLHLLARRRFSLLHFSGHGQPAGIYMEDPQNDGEILIDIEKVRAILKAAAPQLCIAMFMSCFSASMADKLIDLVPIRACPRSL
jgi:CHAT domain-containing protein